MYKILVFIYIGLIFTPCFSRAEESININAGNGAMQDAIDMGRKTLPIFLKNAVDNNGESHPQASVKVGFDTNRANIGREYLWVGPFVSDGKGGFTGELANEPKYINELHVGEQVSFRLHDIIDWSIWLKDQKSYGEYTTRVLIGKMSAEESAAMSADMSANPMPSSWK